MSNTDLVADMGESVKILKINAVEKLGSLLNKIYEGQNVLDSEMNWTKLHDSVVKGEVVSIGTRFNDENELKAFADYAKRDGLVWTGVYDPKQGVKGELTHIAVAASDGMNVKDILERVTDDKRIQAIDDRITEISGKNVFSEQDLVNIVALKNNREQIQAKYCDLANQRIFEEYTEGSSSKGISFSSVLDKYTGKGIDKDSTTVAADIENADRYIVCHGSWEEYNGEQYIKTEYMVHNPEGEEKLFHDGRFDGRENDFWENQKADMQEFGGFSDNSKLLRFQDVDSFNNWREAVKEDNQRENFKVREPGEYKLAIDECKAQLISKGYEIREDGEVYNTKNNVKASELIKNKNASQGNISQEKLEVIEPLEAVVIGRQIKNYEELNQNSQELSLAKTNEIIASNETEKAEAITIRQGLAEKQASLEQVEEGLVGMRQGLNSIQYMLKGELVKNLVQDRNVNSHEKAGYEAIRENGGRERPKSMEDYRGHIAATREKRNLLHGMDGDARANEHGRSVEQTQAGTTQKWSMERG